MKRKPSLSCLLMIVALFSSVFIIAQNLTKQEAYKIANSAYKYAYPILSMDATMKQATNVPNSNTVPMRAPVNQFAHARTFPGSDDKGVVRFNFDTMYSQAWLDLSKEPIVLSVPEINRYYMLPMLDMWTDIFAVIGTRTTGSQSGNYAITAPFWNGKLPDGLIKIVAPTPNIWILGRIQTDGSSDYKNVNKIQDALKLVPLSQWGKKYIPPTAVKTDPSIDNKTPIFFTVNKTDGVTMLKKLAELIKTQSPHPNDYPILFELKKLGFETGKSFDSSKLSPEIIAAINEGASDALKELEIAGKTGEGCTKINGWIYTAQTVGTYGTTYRQRAQSALIGLGVNLPEDAIYPASFVDADGKPYDGKNQYVLHFEKNSMPPAEAFWSVTLYDKDGFQSANPLNRFAVGSHFMDNKLKYNTDGSIDLYIQNQSPGKDKESNWLPAPKDNFNLCLRLYSPTPVISKGEWIPPAVRQVK